MHTGLEEDRQRNFGLAKSHIVGKPTVIRGLLGNLPEETRMRWAWTQSGGWVCFWVIAQSCWRVNSVVYVGWSYTGKPFYNITKLACEQFTSDPFTGPDKLTAFLYKGWPHLNPGARNQIRFYPRYKTYLHRKLYTTDCKTTVHRSKVINYYEILSTVKWIQGRLYSVNVNV